MKNLENFNSLLNLDIYQYPQGSFDNDDSFIFSRIIAILNYMNFVIIDQYRKDAQNILAF